MGMSGDGWEVHGTGPSLRCTCSSSRGAKPSRTSEEHSIQHGSGHRWPGIGEWDCENTRDVTACQVYKSVIDPAYQKALD